MTDLTQPGISHHQINETPSRSRTLVTPAMKKWIAIAIPCFALVAYLVFVAFAASATSSSDITPPRPLGRPDEDVTVQHSHNGGQSNTDTLAGLRLAVSFERLRTPLQLQSMSTLQLARLRSLAASTLQSLRCSGGGGDDDSSTSTSDIVDVLGSTTKQTLSVDTLRDKAIRQRATHLQEMIVDMKKLRFPSDVWMRIKPDDLLVETPGSSSAPTRLRHRVMVDSPLLSREDRRSRSTGVVDPAILCALWLVSNGGGCPLPPLSTSRESGRGGGFSVPSFARGSLVSSHLVDCVHKWKRILLLEKSFSTLENDGEADKDSSRQGGGICEFYNVTQRLLDATGLSAERFLAVEGGGGRVMSVTRALNNGSARRLHQEEIKSPVSADTAVEEEQRTVLSLEGGTPWCKKLQLLSVGIPATWFERYRGHPFGLDSTSEEGVAATATSSTVEWNITGAQHAMMTTSDASHRGSRLRRNPLSGDSVKSHSKRVSWKPFDFAPVPTSFLRDGNAAAGSSSRYVSEVMALMERSFFVFLGDWSPDLGIAPQGSPLRRRRRQEMTPQKSFSARSRGGAAGRADASLVESFFNPVIKTFRLQNYSFAVDSILTKKEMKLLVRPYPPFTDPTMSASHERALSMRILREPPMTIEGLVTRRRAMDAPDTLDHSDVPHLVWRAPLDDGQRRIDLRISLALAAGAIPIYRHHETMELFTITKRKCTKCFVTVPYDALRRAHKIPGVTFDSNRPTIDWSRFDLERYAIIREASIGHARRHLTTRGTALALLKYTTPRPHRVLLLTDEPSHVVNFALLHGLCDVLGDAGEVRVTTVTMMREFYHDNAMVKSVYHGLFSHLHDGNATSYSCTSPRLVYVTAAEEYATNAELSAAITSGEFDLIVAVVGDEISPTLLTSTILRWHQTKPFRVGQFGLVYVGTHPTSLGIPEIWCRVVNQTRGMMFRTQFIQQSHFHFSAHASPDGVTSPFLPLQAPFQKKLDNLPRNCLRLLPAGGGTAASAGAREPLDIRYGRRCPLDDVATSASKMLLERWFQEEKPPAISLTSLKKKYGGSVNNNNNNMDKKKKKGRLLSERLSRASKLK